MKNQNMCLVLLVVSSGEIIYCSIADLDGYHFYLFLIIFLQARTFFPLLNLASRSLLDLEFLPLSILLVIV